MIRGVAWGDKGAVAPGTKFCTLKNGGLQHTGILLGDRALLPLACLPQFQLKPQRDTRKPCLRAPGKHTFMAQIMSSKPLISESPPVSQLGLRSGLECLLLGACTCHGLDKITRAVAANQGTPAYFLAQEAGGSACCLVHMLAAAWTKLLEPWQ